MSIKKVYEDRLKADAVITELMEFSKEMKFCETVRLTGGAVVDVLDGRKPKDYDLLIGDNYTNNYLDIASKLMDRKDVKLLYTSKTAFTFLFKRKHVVQILRTNPNKFLFEIEKSEFTLSTGRLKTFDYIGYESRVLVPNTKEWEMMKKSIQNFDARIKKWESKGFKIHPTTYKSYKPFLRDNNRIRAFFKRLLYGQAGVKHES